MGNSTADVLAKVSTEAAGNFVETYYLALESARNTLASYYTPPASMPDGKPLPAIVFNGNIIPDGAAFQEMFEKQMPDSHYEVQSYDCQVLNPDYNMTDGTATSGKNTMSILVMVSGFVRYGERGQGAYRGFSESVVLVPNAETTGAKGKGRGGHLWLIQSQNFRLVV